MGRYGNHRVVYALVHSVFILITGAYNVMFKIRDDWLKGQITGLVCGMAGIMMASYGNGVFGQFPTGILMYVGMVFIFIAPKMDRLKSLEKGEVEEIETDAELKKMYEPIGWYHHDQLQPVERYDGFVTVSRTISL